MAFARIARRRDSPGLRARWNRAFAVLTATIVVCGLAALVGTGLLVDTFHRSAVRVEREATATAEIRSNVVAYLVLIVTPDSDGVRARMASVEALVRHGYEQALANASSTQASDLLLRSQAAWSEIVASAGPSEAPTDVASRRGVVSTRGPAVAALLDQAGAVSRAAARDDIGEAARLDDRAMAVLAALELLAVLAAVRLARRLSSEVLTPVRTLRDSAHHLAAGDLDHRVVVDRSDELGQLGTSFNEMADAVARSQRTLALEATTDSLTGLANRSAFHAHLTARLERPDIGAGRQAVLLIDLDHFKDVNDSLGHAAGDEVLQIVARRLTDTQRAGDLVARLGGDEFAVLLDDLSGPADALAAAERLVSVLGLPAEIRGVRTNVGASIGCTVPRAGATVDQLMHEADVAMYAAKALGKGRAERYEPRMDLEARARHALLDDLAGAAGRGELVVHYQPMVDLASGALAGLEALVRWQHPSRGLLQPSSFIGLAEQSGAIDEIGAWVLDAAARQLRDWQRRHDLPGLWMAVNVSVGQLQGPRFADRVLDVLRANDLHPAQLVLEVTESVAARPGDCAASTLAALRRPGVRIALDDFGTGHSSISTLRQLPVDILKIDRSFVSGDAPGGAGHTLLEALVAMGRHLGLAVVAEGIEDHDQLARLRAMGCPTGQGFLLCRPQTAAALEALLARATPLLGVTDPEAPAVAGAAASST